MRRDPEYLRFVRAVAGADGPPAVDLTRDPDPIDAPDVIAMPRAMAATRERYRREVRAVLAERAPVEG